LPTDTLVTILQIQGVAQSVAGLQQVEQQAIRTSGALYQLSQSLTAGLKAIAQSGGMSADWQKAAAAMNAFGGAANQATVPISKTTQIMELLQGRAGGLIGTFVAFGSVISGVSAGPLLALAGLLTLIARGFQEVTRFVGEAMRIGDQYSQSLTRTAALLGNVGLPVSFAGLQNLARSRQAGSGIGEDRTLSLIGQLGERGFSQGQIQRLVPALQNVELGTGGTMTAERAMSMLLRVLERPQQLRAGGGGGGGRGLLGLATQLGVNVRFTGNIERDLNNLTSAINQKFGGVAEALANTASGTHLRLQQSLTAAMGRLGQVIEVGLQPLMSGLISALTAGNSFTDRVLHGGREGAASGIGLLSYLAAVPGPVGWAFRGLFNERLRQRQLEVAAASGDPVARQQLAALHHIEQNTTQMAGAMVAVLFGQASARTRQAFAYNELNHAFKDGSGARR
jgi:hypothetical protein